MSTLNRRSFVAASLATVGGALLLPHWASADVLPSIERVAPPSVTGEEQTVQKDIWAAEVRFKPVRMVSVSVKNPETGVSKKELVWYIAYRVVVRSTSRLMDDTVDTPERPMFVPELTLTVDDEGRQATHNDVLIPEALAVINRREKHLYKSSVSVVAPFPAITPDNQRQMATLDGVAMWTGINPDTNFFTVTFAGFSNGYQVTEKDGEDAVTRRVLKQRFWRPSDRFDQSEKEIRFKDEPAWSYQ